MKKCAWCHGRLGLGVRSRNLWNGSWWVHVRFCSTHCEALYELERYDVNARRWRTLLDRSPHRPEGLAEPRFFGPGRGSRFGENWSVYFSDSVTSGKLKGSHLFASVIHASRKRV
jgi:hypothetical protein